MFDYSYRVANVPTAAKNDPAPFDPQSIAYEDASPEERDYAAAFAAMPKISWEPQQGALGLTGDFNFGFTGTKGDRLVRYPRIRLERSTSYPTQPRAGRVSPTEDRGTPEASSMRKHHLGPAGWSPRSAGQIQRGPRRARGACSRSGRIKMQGSSISEFL